MNGRASFASVGCEIQYKTFIINSVRQVEKPICFTLQRRTFCARTASHSCLYNKSESQIFFKRMAAKNFFLIPHVLLNDSHKKQKQAYI